MKYFELTLLTILILIVTLTANLLYYVHLAFTKLIDLCFDTTKLLQLRARRIMRRLNKGRAI